MKRKVKTLIYVTVVAIFLLLVLTPHTLYSRAGDKSLKFSLRKAIDTAMAKNPLAKTFRIVVARARLNLKQVQQQRMVPKLDLSMKTGLVPEARGDIFGSPDKQSDLDGWGPFYKVELKVVQPLFTFGKISTAARAAGITIDLASNKEKSDIEKFKMQIINSYWTFASAGKAGVMARDLRKSYLKLLAEVKKKLNDPESEVDDTDLLEVVSNQYQIEDIFLKTLQGVSISQQAFNIGLGLPLKSKTEVLAEPPPVMDLNEEGFAMVLSDSLQKHPTLKGLQLVRSALEAKKKFVLSQKKPVVYLAAGFAVAYAPHRSNQSNPFVYDPFNYAGVGAFLGFEWDLNDLRPNYESQRLALEKEAVTGKLSLLRDMIKLEIGKAFADVNRLQKLLHQVRISLKAAKTWLRLSMDNWGMGIGEVNRIIKAYNAYYQLRGIEIRREYDLNIALAKFAYMLGNIDLYSQWVEHEKVFIR